MKFGPQNRAERVIFAEENIRVDFQHRLRTLLNYLGITHREFAKRAKMSEAAVSRLFSPSANPSIKTVARLFDALDDECIITSCELEKRRGRIHHYDLHAWTSVVARERQEPTTNRSDGPNTVFSGSYEMRTKLSGTLEAILVETETKSIAPFGSSRAFAERDSIPPAPASARPVSAA